MAMDVSTRRRKGQRRKNQSSFLSEEESDGNDDINTDTTRRASSRIYHKRHKPEFKLPTRNEIWKDIPSVDSCKIRHLTPRKTVNNFTKVYNNYNFDDYEDTSDDVSSSETASESDIDQEQKKQRVKNHHKRIQVLSSSSDEEGTIENLATGSIQAKDEQKGDILKGETESCKIKDDNSDAVYESFLSTKSNVADSDSEIAEVISPSRKNTHRKCSVLESDSDEMISDSNENSFHSGESFSSEPSDLDDISRTSVLKSRKELLFQKFREEQNKRKSKSIKAKGCNSGN